jgi:hypothetical protein
MIRIVQKKVRKRNFVIKSSPETASKLVISISNNFVENVLKQDPGLYNKKKYINNY